MDYQTKIIVDAAKATRDLEKLEKVFNRNDKITAEFSKELNKLNAEQKKLENQTKRLADANLKSASALQKRLQRRKELANSFKTLNALMKNEIKNSKHLAAMKNLSSSASEKAARSNIDYSLSLERIVKATRSTSDRVMVLTRTQRELNKQLLEQMKLLNSNIVSMSKYKSTVQKTSVAQKTLAKSTSVVNDFLRMQLVLFRTAMLAASAFSAVKLYINFNKTAESIDLMGVKLETFTGNAESLNIIKQSAFKTGFAIQDLGKIITRFAITTDGAFSTNTLAKWTEGLVMSARAAGTSTMELNNALIQLSQSFSAGFLMGDEYRSISENLPLFKMALREVADEAGFANISLKELSSQRKLDVELMTKGLERLSEKSMEYTFALDNIEAAEQRVNVGWELWANSVADSRTLKDSLNFLAGLMVNLAEDGATMNAFTEGFPEMAQDVEELTSLIYELYDTTGLVYDIWADFFSMFEKPGDEEFRLQVFNDFLKFIYDAMNDLPINIETLVVTLLSSFMSFADSLSLLFGAIADDMYLNFMDTFATIDKYMTRIRIGWNVITGDEEEEAKLRNQLVGIQSIIDDLNGDDGEISGVWDKLKKDLDKRKALDEQVRQMALAKRLQEKADFDFTVQQNKDFRDAIAEEAKNMAQIEPGKDKGISNKKVDAKAVKEYQKSVAKAEKDLLKFFKTQREIEREIFELENPFNMIFDNTDNISDMEKNINSLNNARKLNIITEEQYASIIEQTIASSVKLMNLEQQNLYEEKARSYDEVKAAAYDLIKAETELKELTENTTISEYALVKVLYEKQRVLFALEAKSGEMTKGEQAFNGLIDGMKQFGYESETVFESISSITNDLFSGMTEQMAQFVETGKLDFGSLIDSMIADILRLAIQESITKPLAGALVSGLGSMFGATTASSMIAGQTGYAGGASGVLNGSEFASWEKGGIFNSGNVVPFARGGVVNKPTLFPMANGAGLMGEAGPEAIMPLSRGSDGKLGVKGGGSATVVNIFNNGSGDQVTENRSTDGNGIETIDIMIERKVNDALGNGSLDKSMSKNFGAKRQGF